MKRLVVTLVFAAIGCTSEPSEPSGPGAAARELGIASYAIHESETQLSIDGFGAAGETIATLQLSVGTFMMDTDVDDRGLFQGRQMDVTVLGNTTQHQSEGMFDLTLPVHRDAGTAVFLADPVVSASLARWGIAFRAAPELDDVDSPASGETPYLTCPGGQTRVAQQLDYDGCSNSTYVGCPATYKKKFYVPDMFEWGEYRCCTNAPAKAAHRACRAPNTQSGCGLTGTGDGTWGCAVCWTVTHASGGCTVTGSGPSAQCLLEYCI